MRAAMAMASPSNTNTSGNNIIDNTNIISNTVKENQNPETASNQAGATAAAGGSPHDSSNAEAVANTASAPALQPELRDVNPEHHITEIFKIPSYSRWFSWDTIHSTERRFLQEFFDGKSAGKTPAVYKDYRDFIIGKYRENPQRKITCTEVRRMLVGDVNCVRRVFDFLENWGLINYQAVSAKQQHSKAAEININGNNNNIINNRSNSGKNAVENVGQGKGILAGKALSAAASCDRDRGSGATDGKTTAGSTVMDGKPTGVSTTADGKGKEKERRAVLCNVCRAECNKLRYACLKEIKPKLEEEAPSEEPGNSSGINDSSAEGLNRCKHDPEKETPNEVMDEDPKDETNDEEAEQNGNKDKTVKKPDKLLRCPRCDSLGTKFCYYNNYNVNQPRYFCKNCQRYWTAGGTMRNVPVGAGRRKNKHSGSYYWSEMKSDDAAYYQAGYVLCPKCYSNGNYGLGLSAADFKRVEIKEESIQYRGVEWTDQETFRLLEAAMLFNDDWKHVAQHVGTKSEAECVTRFIQLPFGEQYMGSDGKEVSDRASSNANVESTAIKNICSPKDCSMQEHQDDAIYDDKHFADDDVSGPLKQSHVTPFADASNPILAQVAFLSTMAGSHVAEAAAKAAVAVLCEDDLSVNQMRTTQESKSFNQKNGITASMTVGLEKDFQTEDDKKELHGGTDPMTQDSELFSGSKRSTPTMEEQEVTATVLESAAKRAKLLLDQQEQDIEHSFSTIIDTQMKVAQEKIQHFDEMEIIMEKEHSQLQQINHLLSLDRLHFIQQTMKSRFSGSQGKELDGS